MKKGNIAGIVAIVVGLVLAVVLLTSLAFPQMRYIYQAQTTTDDISHTNGANTTATLTETDMVTNGLSIAGLTVSDNYTVSYSDATVTINDSTATGTYTATYTFYEEGYSDDVGTRALAGVVIVLILAGLVAVAFKMFGAT